jgi:DNA-binding NtrC family response regulator
VRLLVVEDEEAMARAMKRELNWRFDVLVAHTAEEAMEALASRDDIAAAVCDCELGAGQTGLEVLESARKTHPHQVRLMISGTVPRDLGPLMVSGVVHRFVAKPWYPGELGRALIEALRGAR